MPSYYPVYLDLKERYCLVIGGGYEAERKVLGLLDCGAKVTVINTQISDVLGGLASRGVIDWKARAYNIGDLEGFFLVVAENDDLNLCKNVAMEAEERGVLLNVVDVTHLCNFIAPAIVRRGEVSFAISTGGLSPALARRLREELDESPILRWAEMAEMIAEVRVQLRREGVRPDPERWQECMDEQLLHMFHQGLEINAKERLLVMLREQPTATRSLQE